MKRIYLILILAVIAFSSGCADNGRSEIVEKGDNISVNYIGMYDNGTVFDTSLIDVAKKAGIYDTSRNYEPLVFVVGAGQMISGFDNGVLNMTIGENKTLKLSPDEAYGEYKEEYLVPVPRSDLENNSIVPEIGRQIGTLMGIATIVDITDTNVTLDFNSPLAGKNLTFDITVVSIEKAKK
ncbi:peptidylprolyl isomerase [Methanomethylovorans sp.]|uniref:FKBP-type peptidyl-prolyl cis-trans isomerase n=1 Tax=Methanomethylovorans sp. TaxID=2758717 RepID=UPI000AD94CEC|nr:peptidylprolyl isomerase [Methanomethylovorans sp.]